MPPPRVPPPRLPGPPSPDYTRPPVQYDAWGRPIVGRGSTPPTGERRGADPYEPDPSLAQAVFGSVDRARALEQLRRVMALHGSAGQNLTQEEVTALGEELPQITPEQQEAMRQNWDRLFGRPPR